MEIDDKYEAVLRVVLKVYQDTLPADVMAYEEVLRALQVVVPQALGTLAQGEQEQAARTAVDRLDPHAGDQYLDYPSVLLRLQEVVDRELFRWTSAALQPPGPSGGTAVAEPPPDLAERMAKA